MCLLIITDSTLIELFRFKQEVPTTVVTKQLLSRVDHTIRAHLNDVQSLLILWRAHGSRGRVVAHVC